MALAAYVSIPLWTLEYVRAQRDIRQATSKLQRASSAGATADGTLDGATRFPTDDVCVIDSVCSLPPSFDEHNHAHCSLR